MACAGVLRRAGPPPLGGTGRLQLPLVTTAASGQRYRLARATFSLSRVPAAEELSQPAPDYPRQLQTDSVMPASEALDVGLPAGEYTISLDDWSLERLAEDGSSSPVTAGLLSSRIGSFELSADAEALVRFRFEVSSDAGLASAEAAPGLGVLERPGPLSGRVCVESTIAPEPYALFAQADIDALRGCTEVRGEVYVGPQEVVDLTPLSTLRRVCGPFTLSGPSQYHLQSLAGLEALEEVDALTLLSSGVESLSPLRSLRRIQTPDPASDVLGLFMIPANVTDLSGLENVTEIRNLRLDASPRLVSMRGLRLPEEMKSVEVRGENLDDLVALEGLIRVSEGLAISSAAVDLSALSQLRSAGSLSLNDNRRLQNADALAGLESLGALHLGSAGRLAVLPELALLTEVDSVTLAGTRLTSLSLPALTTATSLIVTANTKLQQLSLPQLTRVGSIEIAGNDSLTTIDLGALSSAASIKIFLNQQLQDADLRRLEAIGGASTKIGNNSDSMLRDPCPWTGDGFCDEPGNWSIGFCAVGSDGADCAPSTVD